MNELEERIRDLRAATFLGCGDVSRRVQSALHLVGYHSRLVAVVTTEAWDGISDGHTALEVKIDGKWQYIDPFTSSMFVSDGRVLNLYEVVHLANLEACLTALPDGIVPVFGDWMKRVYQVPLIFDGVYFWTYDEEIAKRQPVYHYLPEKEWLEKFYGCG